MYFITFFLTSQGERKDFQDDLRRKNSIFFVHSTQATEISAFAVPVFVVRSKDTLAQQHSQPPFFGFRCALTALRYPKGTSFFTRLNLRFYVIILPFRNLHPHPPFGSAYAPSETFIPYFLKRAFMRWLLSRICLRIRRLFGVTSSSSSSARNSRQSSRLSVFGGIRRRASSLPLARVFVKCFFLQTLTTMSSDFGDSPTTMPS